jgi:RIO kinase 1
MSSHAERKLQAAQDLMQYMAPGSVIGDLLDDSDDYDDDDYIPMGTSASLTATGAALTHAVARTTSTATRPNEQSPATSISKMQPQQHIVNKAVTSKIKLGEDDEDGWTGIGGGGGTGAKAMNHKVLNELRGATSQSANSTKNVDRSERATVENVMDPRTRMILYKLVNSGFLKEINGCVSTGKEANVYYAVSGDGSPAALKVFKTSILVFKDRDQYVSGEFRFQNYCKSNPRKMVRTWAEKEARNLTRLANAGIHAPRVRLLRQHVIVMDFIGDDGWPAPRLKEVTFPSAEALDKCYLELLVMMRTMFTQCRLVHGDLSEYNLLVDGSGRIVMIDVSQSVEHDHPHSMAFLRRDIVNVNSFFRTKGHRQLFSLQRVFQFVTAPTLAAAFSAGSIASSAAPAVPPIAAAGASQFSMTETAKMMLSTLLEMRDSDEALEEQRGDADDSQSAAARLAVEEQVFLSINMPRTLGEISDARKPNSEIRPFVEAMLAGPETVANTKAMREVEGSRKSKQKVPGKDKKDNMMPDEQRRSEDHGNPANSSENTSLLMQKVPGTAGTRRHADPSVGTASSNPLEPPAAASSSTSSSSEADDDDDSGEEQVGRDGRERPADVVKFMSKEEKKAHKKAVKEANRERREKKVAKADKKKATRRVKHK